METEASLAGLGAILSHQDDKGRSHLVAYASRALHKHERNYHVTELETLGIVWAAKYFRAYLLGHHCLVLTDHAACTSLLNSSNSSTKLARWAMIIQEMDLDIQYQPGNANHSADALSRENTKVCRPLNGPYRILCLTQTNAKVRLVNLCFIESHSEML